MNMFRQTSPLFLSCTLLLTANGLLFIIVPVSMRLSGVSTDTIGLVSSMYFAGMLVGSLYGRALITRVGHIRIFAACAAVATISSLIYPVFDSAILWAALRVMAGLCNAILFLTMETWLSESSSSKNRGTVFGAYQFVTYLGLTLGQLMLILADPSDSILFSYAAGLFCLCMLPVLLSRSGGPPLVQSPSIKFLELFKLSPLGVVGVAVAGVTLGALYNLVTIFAADTGMTNSQIAIFSGSLMVGGFLLQFPVGKLSDIFDRRTILIFTLGAAMLSSIFLPVIAALGSFPLTLLFGILVSGTLACIYPIALADAFDRLNPQQMVPAGGKLILMYALGGVIGPYTSSVTMNIFGSSALFTYLAAFSLGLAGFAYYRILKRKPIPEPLQESFVPMGLAPLATELDPRTEYTSLDEVSVGAETVVSLAQHSPDDILSIAISVTEQYTGDEANIAAYAAYHFSDSAVDIATTICQVCPERQIDIISQVIGVQHDSCQPLTLWVCDNFKNQNLSQEKFDENMLELAQSILNKAPSKANDMITVMSPFMADEPMEVISELARMTMEASPEHRVDVAATLINDNPDMATEVASVIAEAVPDNPEEELHTVLAAEQDENYGGDLSEFTKVLAKESPDTIPEVAATIYETAPEEAVSAVASLVQSNPDEYEDIIDDIAVYYPAMAEEIIEQADADALATEDLNDEITEANPFAKPASRSD